MKNFGTGIHEVVIIAAACTVYESCIFCIEEPELHLNPVLQKRLIRYLANTENQYIISTHSPHFIDGANANVFHVSIRNGLSNTTLASTETSRHGICMDLGIRASDIMQSNCVVWVEGPSDRIIVRHWISMTAPELEEGIHYSIMFYGGRLLSHLTVDDDAVGDFIFLGHMNRRSAIIMDSDRASIEGGINNTKTRVVSEFSRTSGFCWITAGREVENYYEPESLESAICEIYGEGAKPVALGEYDHVWRYLDAAGKEKDADKVKLARKVAEKSMGNRLDLQDKVKELVAYIKDSN